MIWNNNNIPTAIPQVQSEKDRVYADVTLSRTGKDVETPGQFEKGIQKMFGKRKKMFSHLNFLVVQYVQFEGLILVSIGNGCCGL